MTPKRIVKIMIDVMMTILFLVMMAYHITGNKLHEWLGALLFVLFILHNLLNWKWYQALFKGKYTAVRRLHIVINLLLVAAMIGMMVSGIVLSRNVFHFLNFRASWFGRRLHMLSASWGFVLMSAHLGLHWGMVMSMFKRKPEKEQQNFIGMKQILVSVLAVYGVYAFYVREVWKKMFLLIEFAFFDYDEPSVFFFADYITIMIFFAWIAYYGKKSLQKSKIRLKVLQEEAG